LHLADLLVSGVAFPAAAASSDERNSHLLPDPETPHLWTDCGYEAGKFVARDVGKADVRVVSLPAMPVAAAKAGRLHFDNHPARRWLGVRHKADLRVKAKGLEHDGFHDRQRPLMASGPAMPLCQDAI
jgi:hypothetical protein